MHDKNSACYTYVSENKVELLFPVKFSTGPILETNWEQNFTTAHPEVGYTSLSGIHDKPDHEFAKFDTSWKDWFYKIMLHNE